MTVLRCGMDRRSLFVSSAGALAQTRSRRYRANCSLRTKGASNLASHCTIRAVPIQHETQGHGIPRAYSDVVFGIVRTHIEPMVAANYRLMLTSADKYCVERTRPGEPTRKTSDFASQSMAHNWIDRDKEREAAFAQQRRVASRRPTWWISLWWRS